MLEKLRTKEKGEKERQHKGVKENHKVCEHRKISLV